MKIRIFEYLHSIVKNCELFNFSNFLHKLITGIFIKIEEGSLFYHWKIIFASINILPTFTFPLIVVKVIGIQDMPGPEARALREKP
jgi:hypothetical protein